MKYNGNTNTLSNHLQRYHHKENAEYLGFSSASASTSSSVQQPTIATAFGCVKKIDLDSTRGRAVTEYISGVIVEDLRPYELVSGEGFKKMLGYLTPDYPLASSRYYASKINDKYVLASARPQEIFGSVPTVAITVDLWTSQASHSYLGITTHFLDGDWKQVARLVDCMELPGDQHTAADIALALKTRLQHWRLYDGDVSRVVAATSDNGRNMVNALGRDGLGISPVIGCVAHTINLCVEDGFKVQRVSHLLAKIRRVVEHFHKSTKSTYQLREAQLAAGKNENDVLGIVQDVKTRWTSAYFMLKRCVELADYLQSVLQNADKKAIRDLAFSAKDVYEMKELSAALQPLCLAMQGMGGETYCSLSMAEPILYKILTKSLQATEEETPIVFEFKRAAYENLARRYQDEDVKAVFAQASLLDPRFKDYSFVKDGVARPEKRKFAEKEVIKVSCL